MHTPCRKPYFYTTLPCEERVLSCNESVMDSILFQPRERDLRQGQSAAVKSQERVWAAFLSVKSPPLSSSTMLFLLQNHLAWSLSLSLAFSPISVFIVLTPFWPLPLSPSLSLSLSQSPLHPFSSHSFRPPFCSPFPHPYYTPISMAMSRRRGGRGTHEAMSYGQVCACMPTNERKRQDMCNYCKTLIVTFEGSFLLIDSVSTLVIKRAALLYSMPIRGFQ